MEKELARPNERIELTLIKSALEKPPKNNRYRDTQSLKRYLFEMAVDCGDKEVAQLLFMEMERSFENVAAMHLVSPTPELLQEAVELLKDTQRKDIKEAFSDDMRNPKSELVLSRSKLLGHIALNNTLTDTYMPGELVSGVSLSQKVLIFESEAGGLLSEARIDEYKQLLHVFLGEYKRYLLYGMSSTRPPLLYLIEQLQKVGNLLDDNTAEAVTEKWLEKFEAELKVNNIEDEIANKIYDVAGWNEKIPGNDQHYKSARLVLEYISAGVDIKKLAERHVEHLLPTASAFNAFVIHLRNSQIRSDETQYKAYIKVLGQALAQRAINDGEREEILAISEQSSAVRELKKPNVTQFAEHELFNLIAPPALYDFDLQKRKEVEQYFKNASIDAINNIEDLQVKISGLIYKIYYEKSYELVHEVQQKIEKLFDENQKSIFTMGLAFLVYLERYDSQIRDK